MITSVALLSGVKAGGRRLSKSFPGTADEGLTGGEHDTGSGSGRRPTGWFVGTFQDVNPDFSSVI